jgi:hypothetical protein
MSARVTKPTGRRRTMAELVGGSFVMWAFIWDNARQALGGVSNPAFVLPLPRATKVVEAFILAALLVHVVVARRNRAFEWVAGTTVVLLGIMVTVCSSVIGILAGYTTAAGALYTSYAYLSPLILAAIVSGFSQESDEPTWLLSVFESLVIMNSVVAWYQIGIQHAWGDAVHGAMHDAHMYANVAWLGVLLVLARLCCTGRRWWRSAILLFLFAPTAWAAQHELAAFAFGVVVLAAGFVILWRRSMKWRLMAIGGYGVAGALLISAVQTGSPFLGDFGRFHLVSRNLPTLGIVEGYTQVPSAMSTVPHSLFVGTSPGSYGSAKALQAVLTGGEPAPLVLRYTAESYELNEATRGFLGSFIQRSTDVTALLVEFGPLVLLSSAFALWVLVVWPATRAAVSSSVSLRIAGLWVLASTAHALLLSVGTAFYGWSTSHASVFCVVVAGALLAHRTSPVVVGKGVQDSSTL